MSVRVGLGYDSHAFTDSRPLKLGGVTIPNSPGLAGHSDADAVAHALTDAILGAAGLGDIGTHFSDSDPRWQGADSLALLETAYSRARGSGYRLINADVTVVLEAPKLAPHIQPMRIKLGTVLGCEPSSLSIKAKTNEGLGFVGRGEGIAVITVVLLG